MNILYLAHRIPYPPNKGDKLRSFHQLEQLARRHRVWCACFVDRPEDHGYVPALRKYCVAVAAFDLRPRAAAFRAIRSLLASRTATSGYFDDPRVTEKLRSWASQVNFDAVVAFSSSMAPHALRVPASRHVLDLCDCDSGKWLDYSRQSPPPTKWFYAIEGHRLLDFENKCVADFDETIVISRAEAACLGPPAANIVRVISNGAAIPEAVESDLSDMSSRPPVVGFVGALNYRPNIDGVCWFARTCWPAIREANPTAVFRVIGHTPTRPVRRLAAVPGVAPEIRQFDVSVAPLRIARGLQNKVLEAMAFAKPVVLTSGAADGIRGRDGQHFLIADQPHELAQAVKRLLCDAQARARLGEAARRLVARRHQWAPLMREFELVVTAGISTHGGASEVRPLETVERTTILRHRRQASVSSPVG
jgi:sugar transferase (PEP-CTERM/EpsH1 system associated)